MRSFAIEDPRSPDPALYATLVPIFSHFKMEVVQFFSSAQRRKADEGVRIAHLDPDTRMNSKDEFLQGTNLFLVPVRGVGM